MSNTKLTRLLFCAIALSALLVGGCSDPQKQAMKSLESKGYEVDVRDMLVAAAAGDLESMDQFVAAGISIDAKDAAGNTALIKAASAGQLNAVEKALGLGADPRHVNAVGRDALISASSKGFEEVARMLVSRGADPTIRDTEGWSALSVAAYNGHSNVVSLLSSTAAAAELDDALLVASFSGDAEVIDTLLSYGANINSRSPENKTPLMIAAENGKLEAVRVLLQNQANPYAVDGGQRTAANLAETAGFPEVKELIVTPESWGSSPRSMEVAKEMADAQKALMEDGVEETIEVADESGADAVVAGVPAAETATDPKPKVADSGSTRPDRERPDVAAPVERSTSPAVAAMKRESVPAKQQITHSRKVREEAKEKPIVALNGSTIRSTSPRLAPVRAMVLSAYHEEPLPIVVSDVDGEKAEVRRLDRAGNEIVEVETGSIIPGTHFRVEEVTTKFVSSKEGKGRMVDVSRVRVADTANGTSHLLVKDVAGQTSDSYAILTTPNSQYRYVVKAGDVFRTSQPGMGEREYQVLDIRASGVVIKDLQTDEVVTVARDGVLQP